MCMHAGGGIDFNETVLNDVPLFQGKTDCKF